MQTLISEICSPKDGVCLSSKLSLGMNEYESLVGYTRRKLIKYQINGCPHPLIFFLVGRGCIVHGKKCYWPLEGSMHHCATLRKDLWRFPVTLLSSWDM